MDAGPAKAGHYDSLVRLKPDTTHIGFGPAKPDTTTAQRVASDTGDRRRENSQYGLVRIVL